MSKIKKYIILIIGFIISICTFMPTVSKASSMDRVNEILNGKYGIGSTITLTNVGSERFLNSTNVYCMEKAGHIDTDGDNTYTLKGYMKIVGKDAYDINGNFKTEADINAKFAYYIKQAEKKHLMYDPSDQYTHHTNGTQINLWRYKNEFKNENTWLDDMGLTNDYFVDQYWGGEPTNADSLDADAGTYASGLNNVVTTGITKLVTEINKTFIKKEENTIQKNEDGLLIGPLAYQCSGNMSSFTLKDENGKEFAINDEYKLLIWKDNQFATVNFGDINMKGGASFYIYLTKKAIYDRDFEKLQIHFEAGADSTTPIINAELWFLQGKGNQGLLIAKAWDGNGQQTAKMDDSIEIPTPPVNIKKIDKKTEKMIGGVEFKLKHKTLGWVIKNEDGTIKYDSNKDKATVFTSDANTPTKIGNLKIGEYEFYETKNPIYGYVIENPDKPLKTFSVTLGAEITVSVENEKQIGDLKIIKEDKYNKEIEFEGVGFKLKRADEQYESFNGWVQTKPEGEEGYNYIQNENKATIFYTDENSESLIKGLIKGKYLIYEVYLPTDKYTWMKDYDLPDDPWEATVIPNTEKPTEVTAENIRARANFSIVKVDKYHHETKLKNVGFILRSVLTNEYIKQDGQEYNQNDDAVTEYTKNRSEATRFHTNDNGELTIYNLDINDEHKMFEIYEVENPNGYYEFDPNTPIRITKTYDNELAIETKNFINEQILDKNGNEIETKDGKIMHHVIENEQKYIDLSGFVWEDVAEGKTSVRNNVYYKTNAKDHDKLMEGITVKLLYENGEEVTYSTPIYNENGEVAGNLNRGPFTATTGADGKYKFSKLEIKELGHYKIQFEYDGLTYQNVIPWNELAGNRAYSDRTEEIKTRTIELAKENGEKIPFGGEAESEWYSNLLENYGSKAKEGDMRSKYNDMFAYVVGRDGNRKVQAQDEGKNNTVEVEYEPTSERGKKTFIENSERYITSDTNRAECPIEYDYAEAPEVITELTGFNLGLYRRPQADVAVAQDLRSTTVSIKGYNYVYKHGSLLNGEDFKNDEDLVWNVGVKYDDYAQPVYKADAMYQTGNKNQELTMTLTYKIGLKNQSNILSSRINSIAEYYDRNYSIEKIGTEIDENGNIKAGTEISNYKERTMAGGKYKAVDISLGDGMLLENLGIKSIYIQFRLSRDAIAEIINDIADEYKFESIAEITSYTSYEYEINENTGERTGTKLLTAAVDQDAVLDNVDLAGDPLDDEDDTRRAPAVKLQIKDARQISGYVFEDEAIQELLDDEKIRQGNGAYDASEDIINNVKVTLEEENQ